MVELETVEELAEDIADLVGIYGCLPDDTGFSDHPQDCKCRICFVSNMTERIKQAVQHDIFLANMKEMSKITEV